MALGTGGRNLAWKNGSNGRLTLDWGADGNPKFNDDEADLVFSLLLESPWFGDPTGRRRSLVPTVKTNDSSTAGRLRQYAEDALQPAIDDGRLRSVKATPTPTATGYSVAISYTTGTGRAAALTVPIDV